ncbi:MAG: TonB-dependent receptor, partial [Bacteroidia bacterium]
SNGLIRVDDIAAWNVGQSPDGFPASPKVSMGEYGYVNGETAGMIKRASMNDHNWMGLLSTFNTDLSENFKLMVGVDARRYVGKHYRKVVDLLGASYWLENRDANALEASANPVSLDLDQDGTIARRETGKLVQETGPYFGNPGQAGKVNYDNDGIVGWQGLFTQLEYSKDKLSAFLAVSGSNKSYKRIDRFNYLAGSENETSPVYSFVGGNFKLGANYNVNDYHNVYANLGYYSNQPIFDVIFPNFNNVDINADAPNEKVLGVELGYGLRLKEFAGNLNLYRTQWDDKSFFQRAQTAGGVDFFANIQGVSAVHQGVEVDVIYNPSAIRGLKVTGMLSMGDWQWANNVTALISDDNNNVIDQVDLYLDGVKVGNAAQTTAAVGLDYGKTIAEEATPGACKPPG